MISRQLTMNDLYLSTSYSTSGNTLVPNENTSSLEFSMDNSQTQEGSLPPLLPRSGWNSQVAFLKAVFRAKKALDRIEKEADA